MISTMVIAALSVIALGTANAQDEKGRAKGAEMLAFTDVAQQCANADYDDFAGQLGVTITPNVLRKWSTETAMLIPLIQPPLTDDEIAAGEQAVQNWRAKLGDAKWCNLFAVEMYEGDTLFKMKTGGHGVR